MLLSTANSDGVQFGSALINDVLNRDVMNTYSFGLARHKKKERAAGKSNLRRGAFGSYIVTA